MRLVGEHIYAQDPSTVYRTFIDREALLQATPGLVSLDETAPDQYAAVLRVGIGGFALVWRGQLTLSDKEPGSRYRLAIDAKTHNGFALGNAQFRFYPLPGGGTRAEYDADLELGGAQKLLRAVARGMVDFFLRGMGVVMEEREQVQAPTK